MLVVVFYDRELSLGTMTPATTSFSPPAAHAAQAPLKLGMYWRLAANPPASVTEVLGSTAPSTSTQLFNGYLNYFQFFTTENSALVNLSPSPSLFPLPVPLCLSLSLSLYIYVHIYT